VVELVEDGQGLLPGVASGVAGGVVGVAEVGESGWFTGPGGRQGFAKFTFCDYLWRSVVFDTGEVAAISVFRP
jgi:hypothetical protein